MYGRWLGLGCGLLLGLGCSMAEPPAEARPELRLAGTYSLDESGLAPIVTQEFEARTGRTLAATFVGSGEALERAAAGQADVVWVHARPNEDAFVMQGYGVNRRDVMYSEFVIVGPPGDPAQIKGSLSAAEALTRVARARAPFLSRDDQSGTHLRELALWKLAEVAPEPSWYTPVNMGSVATLSRASERGAYALTDLPTFLVHEQLLALEVLVRGDTRLHNPYGIIAVNPARFPDTDYDGAMAFIDFVTSPAGQDLIRDYGRQRFGAALFHPLVETGGVD